MVEWSDQPVIEIPFILDRRLIVVQATVNGAFCNFIFDTGAPGVVLNEKYFNQDDSFTIHNIDFYGNKIRQQLLTIMDLSGVEQPLSSTIHGLIGKELFERYAILFDYSSKTITLIAPDHLSAFEKHTLKRKRASVVALNMRDHIPLFTIEIKEQQLTIGIDSGAEVNLMDESYFKLFRNRMNLRKIKMNRLIGVNQLPKTVKKVPIRALEIGGILFTHQATVFLDLAPINRAGQTTIDGLIGYEVLSEQPTVLSYSSSELIFYEREVMI